MKTPMTDGIIELERRILRGLMAEWQSAANALKYNHGHALAMPGFELRELDHIMAAWQPEKLLIVFSRRFALEHPWLAVRDIHNAGMEAGRKTVLSKPVSAGATNRRLMLV